MAVSKRPTTFMVCLLLPMGKADQSVAGERVSRVKTTMDTKLEVQSIVSRGEERTWRWSPGQHRGDVVVVHPVLNVIRDAATVVRVLIKGQQ